MCPTARAVDSLGSFVISDVVVSNEGREGEREGLEAITPQLVSAREVVDLRPQAASRPHRDAPPEESAWHVVVVVDARPVDWMVVGQSCRSVKVEV
jgi:hypothetical protein